MLLLLIACLALPVDEKPVIQGEWKAVKYIDDGEDATRLSKTPIRWVFDKGAFTLIAQDQQEFKLKGKYTLNATALDITIDKQSDFLEQKLLGIVKQEGNKLTICYSVGKPRPVTFESREGSGTILIVFEKTK